MKSLIRLFAIAAVSLGTLSIAEARPHCQPAGPRVITVRTACGCVVQKVRYVAYHNRWGQPVYRYRALPVRHQCRPTYQHYRHYDHGCEPAYHPAPRRDVRIRLPLPPVPRF
jgi:hypothetical protein